VSTLSKARASREAAATVTRPQEMMQQRDARHFVSANYSMTKDARLLPLHRLRCRSFDSEKANGFVLPPHDPPIAFCYSGTNETKHKAAMIALAVFARMCCDDATIRAGTLRIKFTPALLGTGLQQDGLAFITWPPLCGASLCGFDRRRKRAAWRYSLTMGAWCAASCLRRRFTAPLGWKPAAIR
jgi:hypothetical protein